MTWLQTYTSGVLDLVDIEKSDIRIIDIATSLSRQCRFRGQCDDFVSVAEHCCLVYYRAHDLLEKQGEPDIRLLRQALLHDVAEAYLGDLPRPVKSLPEMQPYRDFENRLLNHILLHYNAAALPLHSAVKQADAEMLALEKRDNMGQEPRDWGPLPEVPKGFTLRYWSPWEASRQFLRLAEQLEISWTYFLVMIKETKEE